MQRRLTYLLQNAGEQISNQIHTLLKRPSTNEDEEFSRRVNVETGPFLCLATELSSLLLERLVNLNALGLVIGILAGIPVGGIGRIGVGKLANVLQRPEDRVTSQ